MNSVRFIGLDVHKDSIVMSVAEMGAAEAKVFGTFPNDVNKVIKQLRKLSVDLSLLRVCNEAGPTGFGLCRRLKAAGIDCIVVAPSLVPQKSGLRIKTDRRDSKKLAHFTNSGKPRNKAIIAIARELAGFLWSLGQVSQLLA